MSERSNNVQNDTDAVAGTDARELKIGLVQMEVEDGRPDANLERALGLLEVADDCDLFLLPELWSTGYAHEIWEAAAEDHTPEAVAELQRVADERGAFVGGSLVTINRRGRLANRFWLLRPGVGSVHYDKGHLFGPMGEEEWLEAGDRRVRFGIGGWTGALSLCYDLRFPEMYRLDAVDGASLFLVAAEWPDERRATRDLLARARAAENQAYLVLCNRAGAGRDGTLFGGGSMLIAPDGSVVRSGDDGNEVISGMVDPARVRSLREQIRVLDRRVASLDEGAGPVSAPVTDRTDG